MKQIALIAALLSVLFMLLYAVFRGEEVVTNAPPRGDVIVAFGDSLTVGVGATEGHDYVSLLAKRLGKPIINKGANGDTTERALQKLESEVLSLQPDVVIVFLGGNDYLRKVPRERTFGNLSFMIDNIHEEGAVVLLVGVPGGLLKDEYKSSFSQLAKEKKTLYVPNVLSGIIGNHLKMSDPIHPNNEGYAEIADALYPVLSELFAGE